MRLKQKEYEEARRIRRQEGESVKRIAKRLGVAYSSVSMWCRDIVLTDEQNKALGYRAAPARRRILSRTANRNHEESVQRMKLNRELGAMRLLEASPRDHLMAGLGLYLGDGVKNPKVLAAFSNSNVAIQRFMIGWFETHFGITRDRFRCRVIIHEIYRNEGNLIIQEWSEQLEMPLEAFYKPQFITTRAAPKFSERGTYKGTLLLSVSKSMNLQNEILGMADELVYKGGTRKPG